MNKRVCYPTAPPTVPPMSVPADDRSAELFGDYKTFFTSVNTRLSLRTVTSLMRRPRRADINVMQGWENA